MTDIALEGIFNFRDVGGLATHDGGQIQRGRLYRSGTPDRITAAAARRARRELGIQTVVDLRHPDELRDAPSRGPLIAGDVIRHHISPVPADRPKADHDAELNAMMGTIREHQSPERYFLHLQRAGDCYAEAAGVLTGSALPVLVHCTAGKDRTGVLTALVLEVAGVPVDQISADYERSNQAIAQLVAYSRARGHNLDESDAELSARMRTPAQRMVELLALLRAEYGGARGFLRAHGLSDGELDALRGRLVEV
jgi:protein-tyrosine phosphatase